MPCKTLLSLALLIAVGAAGVSQAQTLDRVEVSGHKLRTDVTRACPAIQSDLLRALAPAVYRTQKEGSYLVSFQLQGERVGEVLTAASTPDEYRRPLRRAVMDLSCQDASTQQQPQRYGFILDVRMEDSPTGKAPRMALGVRPLD